jgi:hypothetical protein
MEHAGAATASLPDDLADDLESVRWVRLELLQDPRPLPFG